MFAVHCPPSIGSPAAAYSHGIEVPSNARWLYIPGQVGMSQGRVGRGIEEQAEAAWRNLLAVLASAGDRLQAGHRPASTLLVVSAPANPQWLVEVEAVAAKS